MSPSAPPRDDSGGLGLRSLSSSPHYAQLMEQLAKAREDNAPRQSPSPAASSNAASATVPTSSPPTSSSATAAAAVDSSAEDEERKVSSRVSRTNNLSARLGEKMLAGWTLLGVHCPIDHCPLMKNPRSGDMLCVDCGTVYPPTGAASSSSTSSAGASSSASAASTSASASTSSPLVTVNQQSIVVAVNGTSTSALPAAASTSSSSSASGSRALQVIHRAMDGDDTEDEDDEENDSDERLDRLAAARLGRANGSPPARTNGSPPPSTAATTINDVSAALSEKLLQGWTMLAVECPNPTCACPLVRKKQGPMLCVQCGSTVVTQEEKDRMDEVDRKRGTVGGGGTEHKATEVKVAEEKTSVQQKDSREPTSKADSSSQQQQPKRESEERSNSRSGKRTAFADESDTVASEGGEKRMKNEDDLSDRLSALSSSSLVTQLSSSPLIRPSFRPSAISSARPHRAPPITDASPSTHTPPSTPAPFPFTSPLPASQHLSASISSAFSNHPVFPPPGHITRHNSMAGGGDSGGLPYHANVGMGSLVFGGGPVTQPNSRVAPAGMLHEKGKFSFRSSSAAPATTQSAPASAGSSSGLLSAPPSAVGDVGGMGMASPVTVSPANSDNGVTVAVGAVRPPHVHATVVSSSVDALYGKLDALRGQLVLCTQVDAMQQIAGAMKEIGQALKVLQSL